MDIAGMLIERHGKKFYDKMQATTVGIAGLGGLGSPISIALVRMGLGRLIAYDFDVVELSNIHRQQYYLDQIGIKKCVALKDTLERISPLTRLDMHDLKLDEDNISSAFTGCDLIIEAVDNKYTKAMLFSACRKHYPDVYYIGASGVAGYSDEHRITVKQMAEKIYMVGDFTTDSSVGLVASRVGIVAHTQANLAVQIIMEKI